MARLIGITDIHGEYEKLSSLVNFLNPQEKDTIVFMGDYIDRGPKSREVVDKIIGAQSKAKFEEKFEALL